MFNNVGHSAHIRPIIGCKGNGCIAGCQTNGLAVATMYVFALYALPEQFRLRRFAIVHETGIGNFKGLIGAVRANLRIWLLGTPKNIFSGGIRNRRTPRSATTTPNAATQVRSGWIIDEMTFLCTTDAWNGY